MRFTFTQDNLAKLTPAVRPIVKDGKMVGVEKVAVPKQYKLQRQQQNRHQLQRQQQNRHQLHQYQR